MMGYTNGHMRQKNTNFKNFKIINFLKRPQKCGTRHDREKNRRKIGTELLKNY